MDIRCDLRNLQNEILKHFDGFLNVNQYESKNNNKSNFFLKIEPIMVDLKFQNSVFFILTKSLEEGFLLQLYSYDHTLLERLRFFDGSEVYDFIGNRLLKTNHVICPGLCESETLFSDTSNIIIHPLDGRIYTRARDCLRVISDIESPCAHCQSLENESQVQNFVKQELTEDRSGDNIDSELLVSNENPPLLKEIKLSHISEENENEDLGKENKKNEEASNKTETISCPFEKCHKRFRLYFGKVMRRHLLTSHKIDPDNPPDHIQKILQPPSVNPGSITRDTETGRRLYPCTYEGCSFVAKNVTFLRYHLPSHTGEKMFCCQECGKTFKYKGDFIKCAKRHKGDFKYKCKECDKGFLSRQKLEYHMKIHTGEKPFQCPICIFRTSRPDNLNRHTKKSHGMSVKEAERHSSKPDDAKVS